jgi:hypothetical protein
MQPLKTRDLQPGDVMLKVPDKSGISKAISLGQALAGQFYPWIVHAGVMFDNTYIIEAQGKGISANDLRVQNLEYGYVVFRPVQQNFGQGAGTCAKLMFDIQTRNRNLKYNLIGAIGSLFGGPGRALNPAEMDGLLDRILAGKNHPFFCSQFVVYVYQFVAEQNGIPATQVFNLNDAKVSPSILASRLENSDYFNGVGLMVPKQR